MKFVMMFAVFFVADAASAQVATSQVITQQVTEVPVCASAPLGETTIETNGICFKTLDDCNRQRLILSDMERGGVSFSTKCDQVLGTGVCEGLNFVLTSKVTVRPSQQ